MKITLSLLLFEVFLLGNHGSSSFIIPSQKRSFCRTKLFAESPLFSDFVKTTAKAYRPTGVGAPKVSTGNAPSLSDYLQDTLKDYKLSEGGDSVVDGLKKAGSRISASAGDAKANSESVKIDFSGVNAVFADNRERLLTAVKSSGENTSSIDFSQIATKLNFEEYGALYIFGFSILLALFSSSTAKKGAEAKYSSELTKANKTAEEAANAAKVASADTKAKYDKDLVEAKKNTEEAVKSAKIEAENAQKKFDNDITKAKKIAEEAAKVAKFEAEKAQKQFDNDLMKAKKSAEEAADAASIAAAGSKAAKELVAQLDNDLGKSLEEINKLKELEVEKKAMDEEMKNLEKSAEEAADAAKIAAKEAKDAKELVSTLEEQGAAELEKALEEIRKLKALEVEKKVMDEKMKKLEKSAEEAADATKIAAEEVKITKEMVSTLKEQGAVELEKALVEIRKLKEVEVEKGAMDAKMKKLVEEKISAEEAAETLRIATKDAKAIQALEETGRLNQLEVEKEKMDAEIKKLIQENQNLNLNLAQVESEMAEMVESPSKIDKSENSVISELKDQIQSETEEAMAAVAKIALENKTTVTKKTKPKNNEESLSNPWGTLKEATLKRKTVAQLKDYLQERNVEVVDGMKKADLVKLVVGI